MTGSSITRARACTLPKSGNGRFRESSALRSPAPPGSVPEASYYVVDIARKSSWGPIACATDRGCVRKFAVTRMRCDVTSDEACFYESVVFFSQQGVCFRCLGCLGCLTCVPWSVCIASHRIKSQQS